MRLSWAGRQVSLALAKKDLLLEAEQRLYAPGSFLSSNVLEQVLLPSLYQVMSQHRSPPSLVTEDCRTGIRNAFNNSDKYRPIQTAQHLPCFAPCTQHRSSSTSTTL